MTRVSSHAPADHYHPERDTVTDLDTRLMALRRAAPLLRRVAAGAHHGIISACAALVAYLPVHALGVSEGFWSAIAAIAVVQSEFQAVKSTARDQFVGAAVGGLAGLGPLLALGHDLLVYSFAVILAMSVCWASNMASASRLAGITATIMLLVPRAGTPEQMFFSRVVEVGWGVCAAVAIVWVAARVPTEHLKRFAKRR